MIRRVLCVVALGILLTACTTTSFAAPSDVGQNLNSNKSAGHWQPRHVSRTDSGEPPAFNLQHSSLVDLLHSGQLRFRLIGDGVSTSHVRVVLTHTGREVLDLTVPAGQCLVPDQPGYQTMMTTDERLVEIPAGKSRSIWLSTICASSKNYLPPPEEGVHYQPDRCADQEMGKFLLQIFRTSEEMDQHGDYNGVLLTDSNRQQTIGQLAVWMELGRSTKDPRDDVTIETITTQLLESTVPDGKKVTQDQRLQAEGRVRSIFDAVDFTLKSAHNKKKAQDPEAGATLS